MADQKNRYPGAQPFSDDDLSRKVFFGREGASRVLADKILANRVVVVYARSGLGKTSLLKAGVAPRLREEGYLPLFVRVNDAQNGPFHSVLETIPTEAERQRIEYVPGLTDSLWSFFKTAEFWRQDLLLTPILILDQFEELFTLQSEPARRHFLDELSYLIRGVRPPSAGSSASEGLSEHPPLVQIVLSLREDYLGLLEEAAEHIPQILDTRYRLAPLDLQAAREAIVGPAGLNDPDLETRPFTLDGDAVSFILDYLSRRRTTTVAETSRYVEPFQLQLICRRIELISTDLQTTMSLDRPIMLADIGGEDALSETLRNFYSDAIGAYPDRRGRRACRRLCEEYLISSQGRRLSLEQEEILRQLNLPEEAFSHLVASRLLRTEKRSDSTYYELSHDALVEPILATRRKKSLLLGWSSVGLGLLLFATSCAAAAMTVLGMFFYQPAVDAGTFAQEITGIVLLIISTVGVFVASIALLRSGAQTVFRYRRVRDAALVGSEQRGWRRGGLVPGLSAIAVGLVFGLLGLVLLTMMMLIAGTVFRDVAANLQLAKYADQVSKNGIGIDFIAYTVAFVAIIISGGHIARWGLRRLGGYSGRKVAKRSTLHEAYSILFGAVLLLSSIVIAAAILVEYKCGYLSPGVLPAWIPSRWVTMVAVDCIEGYPEGVVEGMVIDALLLVNLLLLAITPMRRGLTAIRRYFSRDTASTPTPGKQQV